MTTLSALKRKWMEDPDFQREYDALDEEFALILEVAKARKRARLGWPEIARRMKATRSTIARLETAACRRHGRSAASRRPPGIG